MSTDPIDQLPGTDPRGGVTPRFAGFWIRFVAHLVDSLLILAATFAILYLLFGTAPPAPETAAPLSTIDLVLWVVIAVVVVLFWRLRGATPGKMVCGIRIVDADSLQGLTTGQCIGRYLAYIVSALPFLLGYIWVAFDRRKQGFHDKLAGTVVIREADLADELARLDG